jgi:hypothetical protein
VFYAVAFYFVPLLLDVAPGVLLRRLRVLVVPGVGVGTAGVVGRLATRSLRRVDEALQGGGEVDNLARGPLRLLGRACISRRWALTTSLLMR